MENYVFQITPYDTQHLLQQVSEALEKRTELISRKRYPGLWENIDRLHALSRGRQRSSLRRKMMGSICLVLGIFLFIPGLLEPQELLVPLLAGAFAAAVGFLNLYSSRKNDKNPFDQSAKLLLMGKESISAKQSIEVSFSRTGMQVQVDSEVMQHIPYSDFESVVETADLFLFAHDTRITVLQKRDLTGKAADDFRNFISRNIPLHVM